MAAAAVVALALIVLLPPWLSTRMVENAVAAGRGAPTVEGDLRWANRLDPLAVLPYLVEAQLMPTPQGVRALERLVEKEPRYGVGQYYLGVAYLQVGRRAEARAPLLRAAALLPDDKNVRLALAQARRR